MDDIENVDGEKYRDQKMDGGRACDEDEAQNNHNVLIQFCCFVAFAQDTGNVLK